MVAAVATVMLGEAALPSLTAYAAAAATDSYLGATGFVAAAIQSLGGTPLVTPSEQDRELLTGMLAVAESIRR